MQEGQTPQQQIEKKNKQTNCKKGKYMFGYKAKGIGFCIFFYTHTINTKKYIEIPEYKAKTNFKGGLLIHRFFFSAFIYCFSSLFRLNLSNTVKRGIKSYLSSCIRGVVGGRGPPILMKISD